MPRRVGEQPRDVERADQMDVDEFTEVLQRHHAVPSQDAPAFQDARTIDEYPRWSQCRVRCVQGRLNACFAGDVAGVTQRRIAAGFCGFEHDIQGGDFAPASESKAAVASPRPDAAPVTMAVIPSIFMRYRTFPGFIRPLGSSVVLMRCIISRSTGCL